jgi:hypothetical protein
MMTDTVDALLSSFRRRNITPKMSFTSVGCYTVSMLTLIIDLYSQVDVSERGKLLGIMDILYYEEITVQDHQAIKKAISERYLNYTNSAIKYLLSLPD